MPGDNVSKVALSLLTAFGSTATQYGTAQGMVKDVVPSLLA
jgi:hypothetical protein